MTIEKLEYYLCEIDSINNQLSDILDRHDAYFMRESIGNIPFLEHVIAMLKTRIQELNNRR